MQLSPNLALPICAALAGFAVLETTRETPPPPHRIFNLDGVVKSERYKNFVLTEVPEGMRLILTDVSFVQPRFRGVEGPDLLEVQGKRRTVKMSAEHIRVEGAYDQRAWGALSRPFRVQSGLVFGPGSKVVLRCRSSSGHWHYNLNGYYQ